MKNIFKNLMVCTVLCSSVMLSDGKEIDLIGGGDTVNIEYVGSGMKIINADDGTELKLKKKLDSAGGGSEVKKLVDEAVKKVVGCEDWLVENLGNAVSVVMIESYKDVIEAKKEDVYKGIIEEAKFDSAWCWKIYTEENGVKDKVLKAAQEKIENMIERGLEEIKVEKEGVKIGGKVVVTSAECKGKIKDKISEWLIEENKKYAGIDLSTVDGVKILGEVFGIEGAKVVMTGDKLGELGEAFVVSGDSAAIKKCEETLFNKLKDGWKKEERKKEKDAKMKKTESMMAAMKDWGAGNKKLGRDELYKNSEVKAALRKIEDEAGMKKYVKERLAKEMKEMEENGTAVSNEAKAFVNEETGSTTTPTAPTKIDFSDPNAVIF